MRRNYRRTLVLLVCIAGLVSAAPGYASATVTKCAWSTQTSPCPVKRSASFSFWGKASDATPPSSLSITTDGFGHVAKVSNLLADEVGNDETVRVKSTTRLFLVDHNKHKHRIGATAFWNEVDTYDDATIYVTGTLASGSYWDDDPTIVNAGIVVIDISELTDPADDLSGAWTLNGQPATLTATDATDLTYAGQSGGATFTLTEAGSTICITTYAYPPVPNNATTFTCGLVSDDGKTIGPLAWTSPVWGTGTWTFTR
jgi:hypothetical protein